MQSNNYPLLKQITSPADLKKLSLFELNSLSDELRIYLLDTVSQSSGHLASGLGVIELTIALHYVYNAPADKIIWDVGHQAYPHKILTGRRDLMHTIRKKGGLHPFPSRDESIFDVLTTGHSSTSISAALGIAVSNKLDHNQQKVACVIGDGALSAGMAFEAMNHAGHIKPDMLVIVNDNDMSISKNTGALHTHLASMFASDAYHSFRSNSKKILSHITPLKTLLKKTETYLKTLVTPANLFEELGFDYTGTVDGHDLNELINVFEKLKNKKGPQLLHIITQKGKGYAPAEQNPTLWHGVPTFNPLDGKLNIQIDTKTTYSKVFGKWLCTQGKSDKNLIAITPAMAEGSCMTDFANELPNQFYDVAIAEQHAITFAAGLAIAGKKPVVAIYSTFLQRGYDQLIHDVALQNLHVIFAIDRAGIVGEDGATHQGAFDLSFLRCIPNLVIMSPSNKQECLNMLNTAYHHNGPIAIRYPKAKIEDTPIKHDVILEIGKSREVKKGRDVAILNFGHLLAEAQIVADKLDATLIDMRFIKPLDTAKLDELICTHKTIITIEDNVILGGAGSFVNEYLVTKKAKCDILNIGLPDEFIAHGAQADVYESLGLTAPKLIEKIKSFITK